MTEIMESRVEVTQIDLSDHEPVACHEQEGLKICYYDVDGCAYLDFDYDEEGEWSVLSNDETLREVACDLLQRLTGEPYVSIESVNIEGVDTSAGETIVA